MPRRVIASFGVVAAVLIGGTIWAHPNTPPLPDGAMADLLVVEKSARRLSAYSGATLLRSYAVSLGRDPVGHKVREGDRRTPEGRYIIDHHNSTSSFHRALHVTYPCPADLASARNGGYPAGGDIMVHGLRNGLGWLGRAHLLVDWTSGCAAVTDSEIEELYRIVPDGTTIEIKP